MTVAAYGFPQNVRKAGWLRHYGMECRCSPSGAALLRCAVHGLYDCVVAGYGHFILLEPESADCNHLPFYGQFPAVIFPWQ